jgi:N6-adenosine-specific RNA methylase IME4
MIGPWNRIPGAHAPQIEAALAFTAPGQATCGHTTRKDAEFCLLARRGRPQRLAADVREVVLEPVREHSRKPAEVYRRIERFCADPRIELFAREMRPGWVSWGDEIDRFHTTLRPYDDEAIEPALTNALAPLVTSS